MHTHKSTHTYTYKHTHSLTHHCRNGTNDVWVLSSFPPAHQRLGSGRAGSHADSVHTKSGAAARSSLSNRTPSSTSTHGRLSTALTGSHTVAPTSSKAGAGGGAEGSAQHQLLQMWQQDLLLQDVVTGYLYVRPKSAGEWPKLVGHVEKQASHRQQSARGGVSGGGGCVSGRRCADSWARVFCGAGRAHAEQACAFEVGWRA